MVHYRSKAWNEKESGPTLSLTSCYTNACPWSLGFLLLRWGDDTHLLGSVKIIYLKRF